MTVASSDPRGSSDSSDDESPSVSGLSLPPWRSELTSSAVLASVSVAIAFAAELSACAVWSIPALPWAGWDNSWSRNH
eukprot:9495603-Pyramimonas_sp.AAC.1